MAYNWLKILLVLIATRLAISLAAPQATELTTSSEHPPATPLTTPAPQHHTPRTAEVVVIDITKNTSSIVAIPLDVGNLTALKAQHLSRLHCFVNQKSNLFLLVHLNRNWRQKLNFVQKLLSYSYKQGSTNVAIVFFNAFVNVLATFGTDPLSNEAELLMALARVQTTMQRDESSAVSVHWNYFQLDEALRACFRYAKLFLRPFSLDAQPTVLISYFDDGAVITDETVDEAEKVLQQVKSDNPFKASISLMQWPGNLPVPKQWTKVAELLSSSPAYQVTAATEANLLDLAAHLAPDVCNKTMPAVNVN